jgi:hypothetical protein
MKVRLHVLSSFVLATSLVVSFGQQLSSWATDVEPLAPGADDAVVGGSWSNDTDCETGTGGCVKGTVPGLIPCPAGVAAGGFCNQSYCTSGATNMTCTTVSWPGYTCVVTTPLSCPKYQMTCNGATGNCSSWVETTDPVACGEATTCVN